jgi:hypothetical protein
MKARCANKARPDYDRYGGRGITVCEAWRESCKAFLDDMRPTWRPGLELDRIDVDGNYEPGNCRWVVAVQQQRNKRNTRYIPTPNGTMILADAAEASGLDHRTLLYRANKGFPAARMFDPVGSFPVNAPGQHATLYVVTPTGRMLIREACKKYGLKRTTLSLRHHRGFPPEKLVAPVGTIPPGLPAGIRDKKE